MPRTLFLFVAAVALLAGACGGGKGDKSPESSPRRTTTTETDTSTTLEAGDHATPTTPNGPTTTTAKSARVTSKSGAPATTNPNAAPAPAKQGTYDYAQSGTTSQGEVPPDGTLVVSGGGPSQVFKRYVDPDQPPSDLNFVFRDDGPFITGAVVRFPGQTITCTFGPPVPAPPWPPTTGRSFSGHATCTGGYSADLTGSITGRTTDSVGGSAVDGVVVSSTLHVVGTGADITVKDTQHWAPSLRVSTFSHETISGTVNFGFGNVPITGDITSKLKSISPR
ncbi:MAG TPA: hypothetical protein VMZ22_09955 [Acidimicrobiales bacterium]|nr:hypothetical protein [Acidimicrobiales bacterium]